MKVLLVLPPNIGRYIVATIPHAGLAYLAAFLERDGHEVNIQDMRIYSDNKDLMDDIYTSVNYPTMVVVQNSFLSTIKKILLNGLKIMIKDRTIEIG
ncbi:MAG: hypothetical protein IH784_03805 [Bacteroidetes bacterium]|nr:hypothetical protein [Bacteroidota bacterium]